MANARKHQPAAIPPFEWLAAGIGLLLVSTTLVFLVYRGLADDGAVPIISVRPDRIEQQANGYVVVVRAVNRGASTAAGVKVEGELRSGGSVVETAEITFTYLPSNSEQRGGLYFSRDPRKHELVLTPKGYESP